MTRKEVIEFALQWQRREHDRAAHDVARAERFDAENAPYRRRLGLEEAATALIVGLLETAGERTALLLKRAEEYRAAHTEHGAAEAALGLAWTNPTGNLSAGVDTASKRLKAARSARINAEVALHEAALGTP